MRVGLSQAIQNIFTKSCGLSVKLLKCMEIAHPPTGSASWVVTGSEQHLECVYHTPVVVCLTLDSGNSTSQQDTAESTPLSC